MQWEVNRAGKAFGPFSGTQIKQAAAAGQIVPTDYVRIVGEPRWQRATEVHGLFASSLPPAPQNVPIAQPMMAVPVSVPQAAPASPPTALPGPSLQRILLLIAATAGVLGSFMPWLHVPIIGSVSGTQGDGWLTLGASLGIAACCIGQFDQGLRWHMRLIATVLAVANLAIVIHKLVEIDKRVAAVRRDVADNPFGGLMTNAIFPGDGLYVLAVASIATLFIVLMMRR